MSSSRRVAYAIAFCAALSASEFSTKSDVRAQDVQRISIQALDDNGRGIKDLIFTTSGNSNPSLQTDSFGKCSVSVSPQFKAGMSISLSVREKTSRYEAIRGGGRGKNGDGDWQIKYPPNRIVTIPANSATQTITVVCVKHNDKTPAMNRKVISEIVSEKRSMPGSSGLSEAEIQKFLQVQAHNHGFSSVSEMEKYLKTYGDKTGNDLDRGASQLFAGNNAGAIVSLSRAEPKETGDIFATQSLLAEAYYGIGDFNNAIEHYRKALAFSKDDPAVMNSLAMALVSAGKYQEALPLIEEALQSMKRLFPSEKRQIAIFQNNAGVVCMHMGMREKGAEYIDAARMTDEELFGKKDKRLVTVIGNWTVAHSNDNPITTEAEFLKTLDLAGEPKSEPERESKRAALNNLADFYKDRGHYDKAEIRYNEAIRIDETFKHVDLRRDYCNLATLYICQNKMIDAENVLKKALAICNSHNLEDLSTAKILMNLGAVFDSKNASMDAARSFQRAKKIFESLGISQTENALQAQSRYARCAEKAGLENTSTK